MRSADVYCLHARIGQQIIERCIDATIGAGPPGVGSQLLRSLRHRIARSDDLPELLQGRISAFDALRSDRPTPNQPNPHALHHKALLIAAPGRRGPTCRGATCCARLPARGGDHRGASTPLGPLPPECTDGDWRMRVSIRHRAVSSPTRRFSPDRTRPKRSVDPWLLMDRQHDVNNPANLWT